MLAAEIRRLFAKHSGTYGSLRITADPRDEGKPYLDWVLDMGSRRIIGYALGEHHDEDLAETALQMTVAVRGGKAAVAEALMHTDQGGEAGVASAP